MPNIGCSEIKFGTEINVTWDGSSINDVATISDVTRGFEMVEITGVSSHESEERKRQFAMKFKEPIDVTIETYVSFMANLGDIGALTVGDLQFNNAICFSRTIVAEPTAPLRYRCVLRTNGNEGGI